MPFGPDLEPRMRAHLRERPQHRHGVHDYALESFGLDPRVEHARYAAYRKRFLAADTRSAGHRLAPSSPDRIDAGSVADEPASGARPRCRV